MSWFPESKSHREWFDLCHKFDEKMRGLLHLSDDEKAKLVEEFNQQMACRRLPISDKNHKDDSKSW